VISPPLAASILAYRRQRYSQAEIIRILGVSKSTIYRHTHQHVGHIRVTQRQEAARRIGGVVRPQLTGTCCAAAEAMSLPAPATTDAHSFYLCALHSLRHAKIDFLVGGAYALERYTGIARDTKDLDVFVRPEDCERVLAAFAEAGFDTELTFPHWLGKARSGGEMVDVIFSSGNGCARVDDEWFRHAVDDQVLDVPVRLIPVEEMIWSKALIMERERYDGADVVHLLRARGADLDWPRVLRRFGPNWRVLLSHLILFGFVYPGHRDVIPQGVMRELTARLDRETRAPTVDGDDARLCRGTLLSREQYLVDVERWGYRDARLGPEGTMTEADVAAWTAAIEGRLPTSAR